MVYGFFTFWKELIHYLHKSGGVPGHSDVQIKTCKNVLQFFLQPNWDWCLLLTYSDAQEISQVRELVVWDTNVLLNNFHTNMCETTLL